MNGHINDESDAVRMMGDADQLYRMREKSFKQARLTKLKSAVHLRAQILKENAEWTARGFRSLGRFSPYYDALKALQRQMIHLRRWDEVEQRRNAEEFAARWRDNKARWSRPLA